jgi:(2R)-3-sulfolactate dehydrogenase (NADP+)
MGHLFIAIDPGPASGGAFASRMATLAAAMAEEPESRLPGSRRLAARARARTEGLTVPPALLAEIRALIR